MNTYILNILDKQTTRVNLSQTRQYISELEKSVITELVAKQKNVIESKRNDYKSIKQKNMAWETLAEQFNCQMGVMKRE